MCSRSMRTSTGGTGTGLVASTARRFSEWASPSFVRSPAVTTPPFKLRSPIRSPTEPRPAASPVVVPWCQPRSPKRKWLEHQGGDYYEESDADAGYARPDAVTIATVHQAKGMRWPAVFVPCMRRSRFPGKRQDGLGVFRIVPEAAVNNSDRYRGSEDDERRLFYVAATRAQKYLALSFSPGPGKLYQRESQFFAEATRKAGEQLRHNGMPRKTSWCGTCAAYDFAAICRDRPSTP
jgi:superfamily I DNA/RNA helicase